MKKFTIGMIFTLLIFFVGSAFANMNPTRSTSGNWYTQTIVDDMDDSIMTLAFTLTDDYDDLFTGAILVARCDDNELDIAIKYMGELFLDSVPLKAEVRFGKGSIEDIGKWGRSTSGTSIMSFKSQNKKLMKNFINEDQFVIRIHPAYGSSVTTKFNTTGSDELYTVLRACNIEL